MEILSFEFLLFTAALLLLYYIAPLQIRWTALLCGSALFVWMSGITGLIYISCAVFVTWIGGLAVEKRKGLLAPGLLTLLGAMAFIKYEPTMAAMLSSTQKKGLHIPVLAMSIPVGLSYFTFMACGYLIDVKRGRVKAERNPFKLALFITYFPHLTQGPISNFNELSGQLTQGHELDETGVIYGFELILFGAFKKLVIADRLAATTQVLSEDPKTLSGALIAFCVLCYAIRLYADFSGGMDMVRGVSRMFGVELPENFRRPFFAVSLADYWRRWHITLGAWFRSYVLNPISTSRAAVAIGTKLSPIVGKKTARALPSAFGTLIVFVLIGVWHAASLNALIYGGYFGILMGASILMTPIWRKMKKRWTFISRKQFDFVRILRTLLLVFVAQYFAFTADAGQSFALLGRTLRAWKMKGLGKSVLGIMPALEWVILLLALLVLLLVDLLTEKGKKPGEWLAGTHFYVRWPLLILALLVIFVFGIYGAGKDTADFLYTQF